MDFHPFNCKSPWLSHESKNILDRGRYESLKTAKPIKWWLSRFEEAGFKISNVIPVFSKEHLMIWHIGLRPIAHFLILLFNKLGLEERTKIKKEFINHIRPLVWDIANIEPKKEDGFE